MKNQDSELLAAWQKGESIGSIAKRHKMEKSQVKRMINCAIQSRRVGNTEVLQQLQTDKTSS